VLDTGGGIHVSTDAGQTWSTILGTASSITGGGTFLFVANSSGTSYHVNLLVPAITTTGTGSYANFPLCQHPPGCSGYTHTMTVNSKFGGLGGAHGTVGATNRYSAGAAANFNLAVTEYGSYCDPFFGDPSDPSCGVTWSGDANCSGMGDLGGGGGTINYDFETAVTLTKWLGTSYNCSTSKVTGLTTCQFGVENWCTAATTPPDNDFTGKTIKDLLFEPPIQFWTSYAGCLRFIVNGVRGSWHCTPGLSAETSTSLNVPQGNCTSNP